MLAKKKNVYVCQECGEQSPRWQGKCHQCGAWNSLTEEKQSSLKSSSARDSQKSSPQNLMAALSESEVAMNRIRTGFTEVDRVLGGGLVPGSLLLFGGEPGIGKSTLLLQVLARLAESGKKVFYISGEESAKQVAMRAYRLGVDENTKIEFLATSKLDEAMDAAKRLAPDIVVVDSVQTLNSEDLESVAGTVSQIRQVTYEWMNFSKSRGVCTLLVGHVTKEGSIAGPRLLEHMVDAVFYFEMAASGSFRLLRGQKNRYGGTHELAVFEMSKEGLMEVLNPSERFLAERSREMPGSAVVAHLEGSRPFLTEIQILTQRCYSGFPRRTVQGVEQNRVALLMAVIEKTLGLSFADWDVYCKVASGARIDEPAADLAVLFSLLSALQNHSLDPDLIFIGEVGLGGDIRSVTGLNSRLNEAKGVGIKKAFVPAWNLSECKEITGLEILAAKSVQGIVEKLSFPLRQHSIAKKNEAASPNH